MKTLYRAATLAVLFLALAAGKCEGTISSQVDAIAAKAKVLCGYEDRIGAIAKIVAVASEGVAPGGTIIVTGVDATAKAICAAINTRNETQSLIQACPSVNGVCLE